MNILVTGANGLLGNLEGDSKYLITYLANRKDYYLYYVDVEIRKVSRKTRTSGYRAQRRKK